MYVIIVSGKPVTFALSDSNQTMENPGVSILLPIVACKKSLNLWPALSENKHEGGV